ncbi:uncharacterized protein LOC100375478 [Saccoglossus kowalevskii]|uniref:Uncharacterized protein LOC100375478 n=1 Tax=Saccoglossus kowalevskii TaxID=10224 RepID=A0ABM0MEW0_SACKO|nr:PREDICTED: uncharacterized protein LOC100375478 [Saccoglossus kowalevskii]
MAELSGNGHIMSMENKRNRHYFTTTVVFLGIQTLIILFIYPIVIGIVVVSFQNDIMKLEISIDNLKTHKDLQHASDTEPETEQRCTCSETVSENDVTTQVGSSTLRCCTTDEDSVRMLILRIIDEDRRQRNRKRRPDRTTLTVGAIERLVSNIIKQNKTEHAVDTGSNSNTMPSTSIITIAVHLTGRPSLNGFTDSKQLHRQKGYKKVGPWEYNNGQSFARYVQVDDHHIIVPKTGIYYVYSQVCFTYDSSE